MFIALIILKRLNNFTGKHPTGLLILNSKLHFVISIELITENCQLLSYFELHITLKFTFIGYPFSNSFSLFLQISPFPYVNLNPVFLLFSSINLAFTCLSLPRTSQVSVIYPITVRAEKADTFSPLQCKGTGLHKLKRYSIEKRAESVS